MNALQVLKYAILWYSFQEDVPVLIVSSLDELDKTVFTMRNLSLKFLIPFSSAHGQLLHLVANKVPRHC